MYTQTLNLQIHVMEVLSTYTVLIEDWQTHCPRGVDIWVEETLRKLALWWFARVILTEVERKWKEATIPIGLQC